MKSYIWGNGIGIGCALVLGAGCAHQPRASTTVYPSPTSDMAVERVYPQDVRGIGSYAPPPGAPAGDWELAEEIRARLTADPKLAKEPVSAEVNNGIVTLRGYVPNQGARDRLRAEVASLPGVQQVNDQMVSGHVIKSIGGASNNY
jgi:osmotically-inducible protein OsmY